MNNQEAELIEQLNKDHSLGLIGTEGDRFCRWDAVSDKYIAEIKCRTAHYNTQMIQYDKLEAVMEEADKTNREFLYVTKTPKGTYIFNVSKLCKNNYNFNWENKELPNVSTLRAPCKWINKKVGYIDVNNSITF